MVTLAEVSHSLSTTAGLEVRGLHLWRGERHLLRAVSFALQPGELLQVVGPNGAGKTSLLRCVAGLIEAESGEIQWQGAALRTNRDAFHRQLAYLGHINALKAELTALENLRYSVGMRRQVSLEQTQATLARLQIAHCADLPARSLSAGQKRRVALARVILSGASLWILDEPITNLDVDGIACVESCLAEHLQGGGSILTAAHQPLLEHHPQSRSLRLH